MTCAPGTANDRPPNADAPRRCYQDRQCQAERAIQIAVEAIEGMAADALLTDAVILLGQAKGKVADFVDKDPQRWMDVPTTATPPAPARPNQALVDQYGLKVATELAALIALHDNCEREISHIIGESIAHPFKPAEVEGANPLPEGQKP